MDFISHSPRIRIGEIVWEKARRPAAGLPRGEADWLLAQAERIQSRAPCQYDGESLLKEASDLDGLRVVDPLDGARLIAYIRTMELMKRSIRYSLALTQAGADMIVVLEPTATFCGAYVRHRSPRAEP